MGLLNMLKRKNEYTFEEIQKMIEKGKDIGHIEEIISAEGRYTGLYKIASKETIRPIIDEIKGQKEIRTERDNFTNQISGNGKYKNVYPNNRNKQYYTPMGTQSKSYSSGRKNDDYWEMAK